MFVRDPALVRRLAGMRGFGDSSSVYTNPDGSPTYDGNPYDVYDSNNPYNADNQITGPAPAPTFTLPSIFAPTAPATVPPPLINYTPNANAGTAISANGLPANTITAPVTQPSIASLLGPLAGLFGGTSLTNALSPSGGVAPKPATPATTGMSTSTLLLLVGLGVGAFVLLKKRR